jgi:hypothetical protein
MPPRTTSLKFRQIIMGSPSSSLLSMFEDDFEDIDLETASRNNCSSRSTCSSSFSTEFEDDLTLENMSNVIAVAIELSMSTSKCMSSYSEGNASIKYNKKLSKKKENRYVKNPFKWSSRVSTTTLTTATTTTKPMKVYDDGKQELLYRGIQVKEVQTTLDPIIVSTEFTHDYPEITLQRPQFARFNY